MDPQVMDKYFDWFNCKDNCLSDADESGSDSKISFWPFMTTLAWPISIMTIYFCTVTWIGPKYMKLHFPYQIKLFTSRYNLALTVTNLILGLSLSILMILGKYSFWCQPVQSYCGSCGENPLENMIAILTWAYHVLKIVQLLDGILAFLRHRIIAIAHSLHHCLMILLSWCAAKYVPGGSTAVLITISCFTNVVIFSYHKLNRELPPNSSWPRFKKVVLIVQLVQFFFVGLVSVSSFCLSCNYPAWASIAIFTCTASFAMMLVQDASSCGGSSFACVLGFGAPCVSNSDGRRVSFATSTKPR